MAGPSNLCARVRSLMTCSLVVLAASACGNASSSNEVPDATRDGSTPLDTANGTGADATDDACSSPAAWKTPIGSPTWEPYGGVPLLAIIGGTAATNYVEFNAAYEGLFAPSHYFVEAQSAWGPGAPHDGPYQTEIERAFAARGLVDRDVFSVEEFTAPHQVTMPVFLVPRCGAPIARSVDFGSGPIIPNALFPISVTAPLYRSGVLWDPDRLSKYPAHTAFLGDAAGDGASHVSLIFGDGTEFGPPGSEVAGEYEFRIRLLDQAGAGWNIVRKFTVK